MGEFTYEHLFDVLRRERSREEIQELDEGFYDQANAFLADQSAALQAADPLARSTDSLRTQLTNSKKLLRELYDRREQKIMRLSLNKARTGSDIIDASNVLEAEKPLFNDLLNTLKHYRATITQVASAAEQPPPRTPVTPKPTQTKPAKPITPPTSQPGEVRIKVVAQVPKFMGTNSKTYGPYEAGKHVSLPERIASILIKKGRAEEA